MEILEQKWILIILSALAGGIVSFFLQMYLKRRGRLTYSVQHNHIALSGDDAIFGSVRVTWQGREVTNLYASTIELTNVSLYDYENIKVRVFTRNTSLFAERAEVVDTTEILQWTDEYKQLISVPAGQEAAQNQIDAYKRQRDYLVPTLNRGQGVRFSYLNSADDVNSTPSIWLDIVHKGVILKYKVVPSQFWGVSQSTAALVGVFLCSTALIVILLAFKISLAVPLLSFFLGTLVLAPGAAVLKAVRFFRKSFAG